MEHLLAISSDAGSDLVGSWIYPRFYILLRGCAGYLQFCHWNKPAVLLYYLQYSENFTSPFLLSNFSRTPLPPTPTLLGTEHKGPLRSGNPNNLTFPLIKQ